MRYKGTETHVCFVDYSVGPQVSGRSSTVSANMDKTNIAPHLASEELRGGCISGPIIACVGRLKISGDENESSVAYISRGEIAQGSEDMLDRIGIAIVCFLLSSILRLVIGGLSQCHDFPGGRRGQDGPWDCSPCRS